MPIYIFEHPKTKEQREIIQRMNDVHEYTDEKGIKWNRVYEAPFASVDTEINPFSEQDFLNKTKNKKGTMGDLWDMSAELSEKRKKRLGKDPIKEKAIKAYEKKTKGKKHPFA